MTRDAEASAEETHAEERVRNWEPSSLVRQLVIEGTLVRPDVSTKIRSILIVLYFRRKL